MDIGTFSQKLPAEITTAKEIWKPKAISLINEIISYLDSNTENSEYKIYNSRIYVGRLPYFKIQPYVATVFRKIMPRHKLIAIRYLKSKKFSCQIKLTPIISHGTVLENAFQCEAFISC